MPGKPKDDKGRDDEQTLPAQMMMGIIFLKDSTWSKTLIAVAENIHTK